MPKYIFNDSPLTFKNAKHADAQKLGEATEQFAIDAGGEIRTRDALEASRDPKHPYHPHLEWDDEIAADEHRMSQIRSIINCIRLVDSETEKPVHAFLSITSDRGGVAYRTIGDIRSSSDLRLKILKAAERDLSNWEARYRDIVDACALVKSARAKVRKRRERLESEAST